MSNKKLLGILLKQAYFSDPDKVLLREGSKLLPALAGWLCPASEVTVHVQFADTPRIAVVAPNDWINIGQEALTGRLHCADGHLVPLRDECGNLIGRVGMDPRHDGRCSVVLHGVRCGEIPGLVGVALARENNRDARRTEAAVAGSTAAWSRWAEQVLAGQPNLEIGALLKLYPLLPDRDLPVWRYGAYAMTLNDLVAQIVVTHELRIHLGEVSHEDYDDVGHDRFRAVFNVSGQLVITPQYEPSHIGSERRDFPWLLGVAPIDYKSRLEAELTQHWGGFEEHFDDWAVVAEVDGIEIYRSVTVYRRVPAA